MTELSTIINENLRDVYEKNVENLKKLYNSSGYLLSLPETTDITMIDRPDEIRAREKSLYEHYIAGNRYFIESEPDGGYYPYSFALERKAALIDNFRRAHEHFIKSEPDGEYYPYAYNELINEIFEKYLNI